MWAYIEAATLVFRMRLSSECDFAMVRRVKYDS